MREGSYHVHALLETRHSARQVEEWYRKKYGVADVRKYNPELGAVGYVAKYMSKNVHDYDILVGQGQPSLAL